MIPIESQGMRILNLLQIANRFMCEAAYFIHMRIVKPSVSSRNAPSGRGAVEDYRAQAIQGHAHIVPAPAAHEVLGQIAVLTSHTGVALRISKIPYD